MEILEIDVSNILYTNELDDFSISKEPASLPLERPLKRNLWGFGYIWWMIQREFGTIEQLYAAIHDLHSEISRLKEKFSPYAETFPPFDIVPIGSRGVSGSYLALDEEGKQRYVIKPLDEDAGAINNSEGFASPFIMSPLRSDMPLYRSAMREVLAYQIACSIGVGSVVPKTALAIIESDQFHDFSEGILKEEIERYLANCGSGDREKLCSIQEFIPHSTSLFEALHDLEMKGLNDDEIGARFDQTDFEDMNILMWTTYDTDGHMGNMLVYSKGMDAIGNEILGLKKIDNGLAFPEKNNQLRNNLSYLPNAKRELSEAAKEKIANMDVEKLAEQLEKMGLEGAIPALRQRIPVLQELAQQPGITIKEINTRMQTIGKK